MRLATLSLVALAALAGLLPTHHADAALPPAPPEFAQPQSPPKPPPFAVNMVDQGTFDPKLKGYFLPEGFRLEVVIADPDTINPVGMTFGPDGTLYVMEWLPDPVAKDQWFPVSEQFTYRDGTKRYVTTMKKFTDDVVKQFRYNPATGKFGPPKVIISENLPSSILYHEGWLYVTGRGTVRRWRQAPAGNISGIDFSKPASPNDPWNVREVIAQGFCGFHHHQVSGLTIGNDGMLYITSGDDDNYVEGSDGSRATVLRTGAVFRCRPDGSKMETYSLGYRNPYRDLAYDDKFNWFHTDNDNEDGSRFMGCRIMHVAEGTDFGWRLQVGARCCRPDNTRASIAGELPGRVAPMIKTGRGAPAGLLIYNDTRIPEQYRGLLYYPDVYRKLVRAYKTAPDGSTFKITNEFEFFKSDDPLFRPCQMVTGPDGAIYVCDWRTDSGGAGKLSGDGKNGRIYRITWAGTKDSPAIARRDMESWGKLRTLADDKLIEALGSADMSDRVEARKELVRRGAKSRDLVLKRFLSMSGPGRLVAMGVLQSFWTPDVEDLFRILLNDESADVRRLAAEGLGLNAKSKDARVADSLMKALTDSHPAVRRVGALALGRIAADGGAESIVNAWHHDDLADAFLKDAYVRAIERFGKPGIDAVLALAASGDKEFNLAVDIVIALRSREGAKVLPELLGSPHATPAQREALVRSYANYQFDPPISLEPLAEFLTKHPAEPAPVVEASLDVFAVSGGLEAPKATQLVLGFLAKPDPDVRMAAIRAVEATRLAAAAPKLLELLADGTKPQAERIAVVKALRVMKDDRATAPVQALLNGPHPATLKVEALRTLAALDATLARTAATKLLDQPDPTLLAEAVAVLSTNKDGAKLLGERFVAKKLPRDLFPLVSAALQKFADDPAVAKIQADVLKGGLLLSLEPGQIEKVRQMVVSKGDPKKGKEVYLNTKLVACASCHRMEGVGGSIGPDLTRVWDTHTVEKLLESIVEPSKEIKEGYSTYRVTTADGQTVNGLKISESPKEVVIRDANGRDLRIARDEIESIAQSKLSLMPDNVVSQLTLDQFIDLLAFLKSRAEQEALRGLVVEFGVASGPFTPDVKASKPEVKADPSAKSAAKWQLFPSEPNGTIDLKPAFPTTGPGAVYARAFVYSAKKQTVTAAVQTEDPVRVWVNDTPVFDRPTPLTTGVVGDETLTVDLKPGWNVVQLKVVNAGKAHRLGLRFTGEGLRTASMPETVALPMTGGQ